MQKSKSVKRKSAKHLKIKQNKFRINLCIKYYENHNKEI